jgi:hypothetical protein
VTNGVTTSGSWVWSHDVVMEPWAQINFFSLYFGEYVILLFATENRLRGPGAVAHAYNPCFLGGRNGEG